MNDIRGCCSSAGRRRTAAKAEGYCSLYCYKHYYYEVLSILAIIAKQKKKVLQNYFLVNPIPSQQAKIAERNIKDLISL